MSTFDIRFLQTDYSRVKRFLWALFLCIFNAIDLNSCAQDFVLYSESVCVFFLASFYANQMIIDGNKFPTQTIASVRWKHINTTEFGQFNVSKYFFSNVCFPFWFLSTSLTWFCKNAIVSLEFYVDSKCRFPYTKEKSSVFFSHSEYIQTLSLIVKLNYDLFN